MNNQRILIGSIKVNTNQFVAIKHVILKCHHSVEEKHYLVSYTRVKSYKKPDDVALFYHRTIATDRCT